ncbi:methyltransferase domain-containing protein [Octadecabacter sp. R77987]|uniref:methyltransferase domain-containing protein n=1 Tax=Octadecabacter sp. R77987 TaxID=3093874 RepID=UPI00366C1C21
MQDAPLLFDRPALRLRRARAARDPALFIQEAVADEVQEELIEVNRTFTAPAVVTGWPTVWANRLPDATVVADDETLALEVGAHDLVIHHFALHWANDPVGQLVQARRALRPDGLLIATLFGGQTLQELRSALAEAESRIQGGLSPRVAPMGEIRDLGGLLQRAGFAMPVADGGAFNVSYTSALHLMRDLRGMGETNVMTARQRRATRADVLRLAAQIYHDSFADSDGRIPATFEVVTLTGWAPDDSQPKPLRPGSATHRLADVLGTDESKLDPTQD